MAAPKTMTLPPPGRVVTPSRTEGEASRSRYVSLEGPALDDSEERGRALPPTTALKSRHAGRGFMPAAFDAEAAEERLWGHSSELVKKVPQGVDVTADEADDFPSAVISNDQEIISQG